MLSFKLNLVSSFMYKIVIHLVCHKMVSQAYKNEKDGSGIPGHTPGFGLSKLNIHFYILTPVLTNF